MILITGATGKTGSATAHALLSKGAQVRALVRNAEKAAGLADAGIELVVGDATNAADLGKAMAGAERALILLNNFEGQLEAEKGFVAAAKANGVRHIVKVSSMEASPTSRSAIPRLHHAVEEEIKASGLDWTLVKPTFYMQNLLANAATIKSMGKFFLPLGDGRTAMSDCRDIGEVIAKVLTEDGHEGQSYNVTGPELLDFHEVARRFSAVLDKPIEYVNQDPAEYKTMLQQYIPNQWHTDAVCDLFAEIAAGDTDYVTDTVEQLLRRPPLKIDQFIEDHKAIFAS